MREKYIEERFQRWFEFGEHAGCHVDLSDSEGDVIQNISKETAAKLMRARSQYVDAMIEIFMADPDALYKLVDPGRKVGL